MRASSAPDAATLLVCCPDRRGLVLALDSDRATLENAVVEVAGRLGMTWRISYTDRVPRMAIFVSRADHCLYDLLLRHQAGELRCEIPLIVGNHPDHKPVAEQFGIPFQVVPITPENKAEHETRELALLEENGIDLLVLARYMQVLSGDFLDRIAKPIINIHHSFLPMAIFDSRADHCLYDLLLRHQAYERGVKLIGATAHYATRDLDEGPIIEQDGIRASHRHSVRDLVRKGRDVERNVLSTAVRWHLEDRVLVHGNKTVVFA